ncbi:MAG: DNA-binding response regulator [Candidatus Viridilinea halotolerans]|uniref:DNA-binding response regulator n=1 Tax=Candidatus Viridilinea halotolerans TaxID=2491704 RepID=A0A426TTJ5_9CHLR|nr:MAG: DNA-binding response regulator [Candidatus Viridilinea halotolerans]
MSNASAIFRQLAAGVLTRHFRSRITLAAARSSWYPVAVSALQPQPLAVLLGLGADGMPDPVMLAAIKMDLPDVPVVILGYLDDEAYSNAALRAGAAAFISKGAIQTELLPVLTQLVARPGIAPHWSRP